MVGVSDSGMVQVGGDHYTRCAIQPWEVVTRNEMGYFEGNVLKYIMRFANKNGKEDLLKAQHYLAYMIEHYDKLYK